MAARLELRRLPSQGPNRKDVGDRGEAPRAPNDRGRGRRTLVAIAAVAVLATLIARACTAFALGDVPHVQDEQAYWLQARTLALGRIFVSVSLPRAAFNTWFVDDRWARFGIFPPGWPAALALGMLARAAFWVNPVLHGLTTAVVAAVVDRLGHPRLRVLGAALYGLSPQALVLAASTMSHSLIALAASVALLAAAAELRGTGSLGLGAAAGAAIGAALLTRPLCACAIAVATVAAYAWSWRHDRRTLVRLALLAAPVACALALLLAYNRALTGRATRFPQSAYFDEHLPPVNLASFHYHPGCNDLGIGPGHGCQDVIRNATHTLQNALSNTGDNLIAWLLLAGGGPLVFLAAAAALRRGASRIEGLVLALPIALVIGLYALYWYAGTCYGARFYHAALPALLVLATLGLGRLTGLAGLAELGTLPSRWTVLGVVLVAWFGWNAFAMAQSWRELGDEYWGTDARFRRVVDSWKGAPALVMVAFSPDPAPIDPPFWTTRLLRPGRWYDNQRAGAALAQNAPLLDGPVVFAKFHPALVNELAQRFPGRALWLYVETPDASRDRLVPYAGAEVPVGDAGAPPPDNFDGYEMPDSR
jgi:4-amino-4-deoxy-L-arabinose transferase-like glycosyltransferase